MAEKRSRIKSASIIYDDDGATVLSAFKTEVIEFVDDDAGVIELGRRDVDLKADELKTAFGASIDAHLTETSARAAAAERDLAATQAVVADLQTQLDTAKLDLAATQAVVADLQTQLDTAKQAYSDLLSQIEPVEAAPAETLQ